MGRSIGCGLAALLGLTACGSDEKFTDAGPPEIDATGCPALWEVNADPGAAAAITAGALVITASDIDNDSAIEVLQTGLSGDFDLSFAIADFDAGGTGAFIQAAISAAVPTPPQKLTAALGTFPTVGISAADQPGGLVDIQATAETAGTLRFQRTGDAVTITATAGATTATVTATMATEPLQVGVQVGSNNGAIGPVTRAEISEFSLTSGTGVEADAFDCDSLIR